MSLTGRLVRFPSLCFALISWGDKALRVRELTNMPWLLAEHTVLLILSGWGIAIKVRTPCACLTVPRRTAWVGTHQSSLSSHVSPHRVYPSSIQGALTYFGK